MNSKLLLTCGVTLLMCSPPALGQPAGKDNVVITDKSGDKSYAVSFSNLRRATFDGDAVTLLLADGKRTTFYWNDLQTLKFKVVETSIGTPQSVAQQMSVSVRGNRVYVKGLPQTGIPATVYDIRGRLCLRCPSVDTEGADMSALPRGIYIIKTKYASLKIKY